MVPRSLIGSLLVSRKIISRAQLRAALQQQRSQPDKRIGEVLLERCYLTPAQLKRHLHWQKWLRSIAMLIALLTSPMSVLAESFDRAAGLSNCQTQLCSETPQGAKALVIDLARALQTLKQLIRSPYNSGEEPRAAYLKQESKLRLNLQISTEQPGLELVYRF